MGHHGAYYGTTGHACPECAPGAPGRDATDGYDRGAGVPHDHGQSIEADGITGVRLGTGSKNGAAPDVVRAIGHSRASSIGVIGGVADEEARWRDAAGSRDREVTGPEVDAIRTDCKGQVHPVVDEEETACGFGVGTQALGQGEDLSWRQGFFAQLHRRRAGPQGGADDLSQIPGTGEGPVGDHDQPKAPGKVVRGRRAGSHGCVPGGFRLSAFRFLPGLPASRVVLAEGRGKHMFTVRHGDEEEVLGIGRVKGCVEGLGAWSADWAGG